MREGSHPEHSTKFLSWQDDILILLISVKIKPPEALVTLVIIDDCVQWGGRDLCTVITVHTLHNFAVCSLQSVRGLLL